jgi:hypothetical protein
MSVNNLWDWYEAALVGDDPMMHGQKTGKGQFYMAAYHDGDGDWLDSAVNYTLNVPANAPDKAFWSLTVYDVATRAIIVNDTKKAEGDKAKNWIQTIPGESWFPYFRLYLSKQAFLDKS